MQDEAFHNSVKEEARFNIRRLAPHPSLVIWCGNNEMEWGAWAWGYERGVVYPDHALFHLTIPRLLAEEDPGRFYPGIPHVIAWRGPRKPDVRFVGNLAGVR